MRRIGSCRTWILLALILGARAVVADRALADNAPSVCAEPCTAPRTAFDGIQIAQASAVDPQTAEKFAAILGLGDSAKNYSAEIAAIQEALARGDRADAGAAVQSIYRKGGFIAPTGQALDQLVSRLAKVAKPTQTGTGPA